MPEPLRADLVLEGGGIKGIALAGAIGELERAGYTFERVAGASAGAIVACLLAVGATAADLEELVPQFDYESLLRPDDRALTRIPRRVYGPVAAIGRGWAYSGDYLREWLGGVLRTYGKETFGDLRWRHQPVTRAESQWSLMVTVTDLTHSQLLRLPQDFARFGVDPDQQPIVDAVCASAAIPFVFRPVVLAGGILAVDGGFLSNFPIDAFDRTDGRQPAWPTFGVKLLPREGLRLPFVRQSRPPSAARLLRSVIGTVLVGRDQAYLDQPWVKARAMLLDTSGVGILETSIDPDAQQALIAEGRDKARQFLAKWNFEDYKSKYRPARADAAS